MKLMEKKKVSKLNQILNNDIKLKDLSYSKVSDFDRNGAVALVRAKTNDTQALKIGSLVDNLIFEDKDYFNKHYYVFDGEKPTATLGLLCDIIVKNYTNIPNKEQVLQIIAHNNLWKRQKQDTLLANFNIPEFWEYLKCIFETFDKIIVTTKELEDAKELAEILKTHNYSKDVITNEEFEHKNQFYFEFKHLGFNFRGVIDKILIDHKNKKVRFIDLKTGTDNAAEFENSFVKWRYYFQGAIYTLAFNAICEMLNLKGYTLQDFEFLYISKKEKIPMLFKMSKNWLNASIKGFNIGKYRYKGLIELCEEIEWCFDNNEYNIPKQIVDNNGEVYLKDNFIEINE